MQARALALLLLSPGAARGGASLHASIRADAWLEQYPEQGETAPKDGRRLQIVATGLNLSSALRSVTIDGRACLTTTNGANGWGFAPQSDAEMGWFDWCRAHASAQTGALWVIFHTRNAAWHDGARRVTAAAASGATLVNASVTPTDPRVVLSYAATRRGGAQAVLHFHSAQGGELANVTYDGRGVAVPAHLRTVPVGGHVALVVDTAAPKAAGDVWTVTAGGAGWGGRVSPERFPVVAWPHSDDCPLPGAGADEGSEPGEGGKNWEELRELGIDSVYYGEGDYDKKCADPASGDFKNAVASLPGPGGIVANDADLLHQIYKGNASLLDKIDAVFIGDEVDGSIDADHIGQKMSLSLSAMNSVAQGVPAAPTYQGSKTNHNVGAFAGMTDVQGADAYVAACAPTMYGVVHKLPLSYPYDYLRNARDNHAPLPFWGYSQLYSDAWTYQPNANEIANQLGQLVLSGSKAVMFFQSEHSNFQKFKASASAWASVLKSIKHAGEIIRTGDIDGVALTSSASADTVRAGVILAPERLLLTVVNMNAGGYSNLLCHTAVLSRHWSFKDTKVASLSLDLASSPSVASLSGWKEIVAGAAAAPQGVTITAPSPGTVTLSGIDLSSDVPVRFFVADVAAPATASVA